ncbi:TRIM2 [Branchiostoma lanceolatum]|uniref:TRIM2 protein n=1 Tax=Branchiostoma lanceolatum TaxID=7740 RepID=A0A8J9ZDT6_BRALA|nr:TRIM2 [Branchiostoma lanceolatum]
MIDSSMGRPRLRVKFRSYRVSRTSAMAEGGYRDRGVADGRFLTKKSSEAIQNRYEEQPTSGRPSRQVRPSCVTWSQQVKERTGSGVPVRGVCTPTDGTGIDTELNYRSIGKGHCDGQGGDCYRTCREQAGQKGERSTPVAGVTVAKAGSERRYYSVPGKAGSVPLTLLCRECGEIVGGEGVNSARTNHTCGTLEDASHDKQGEANTPQNMARETAVLKKLDALEESIRLAVSEKTAMEEQILRLKEEAIRNVEESANTLIEQVRLIFHKWNQDVKDEMEDLTSQLRIQSCHGNGRQNFDRTKTGLSLDLQRHALNPPRVEFVPRDFEGSAFTLGRIQVKKDKEVISSPRQGVLSTPSRTFTPSKSRFGTSGTKKGQFVEPLCVTAALDHVYVIDRAGGGRVQVFTLKGMQVNEFMLNLGEHLSINGCGLFSDGRFVSFVGSLYKGTLGVDTTYTNVFAKYTREGRLVARRTLTVGSGQDPVIDASGFPDGRVAAALTGKVCILATNGDALSEFDTTVQTYKRVCVNHSNNNILLSLHKTVQVYDERGRRLRDLSLEPGAGRAPLNGPHGLCVEARGNILVADWSNSRVQMFDKEGGFVETVAGEEDGLVCPWGVAVPRQGCAVVIDWREHCVFVFRY